MDRMLIGKNIKLREVRGDDLELIRRWRNDPQYYEFFYELVPITEKEEERWFERIINDPSEILFAISLNDQSERCIGTVGFQHWDKRNRNAEWGRLLIGDKENAPKGAGKEVELLILEYGFEHLGLNKLYCTVFSDNEKVIGLHTSFGFVQEGCLKQHIFKWGRFVDVVLLAMYASYYFKNREQIRARIADRPLKNKSSADQGENE